MIRAGQVCLLFFLLGGTGQFLVARPNYLQIFMADPFRNSDVAGCGTCHVSPSGGGPRNPFGLAFDANGRVITPMLRAEWRDRFNVNTTDIADGVKLYFSDPDFRFVVAEVAEKKSLVDLREGGYVAPTVAARTEAPADAVRKSNFNFFVTSTGMGKGGNLGGLAGADRHCQALAKEVGAGDRTWRAYLSTSYNGQPAINAGDRIGGGPWYNVNEKLIARGVTDLHSGNSNLKPETALTEKGEIPGDQDVLTGSLASGAAALDMNCANWTSGAEGRAMLGQGSSRGCSLEDLRATGSSGLFYCFAID